MAVSFKELLDTFELIAMVGDSADHDAYLCKQTGKIFCRIDFPDFPDPEENIPDDVDDADKYLAIPDRRELGLGKPLALKFADEFLPDDFEEVRDIFSRRHAHQKFKSLLIRENLREQWYEFEKQATERALREWCDLNEIAVTD